MNGARSLTTGETITLADGRRLGYAAYGEPAGHPIFYFTGGNSSRLEGGWLAEAAQRRAVYLVVPDRPGFGLSDFQPGRTLADWSGDVAQLADALAIQRFAAFGLSGGGPHLLAACLGLPDRLERAAIVSGVAPPEMPDRFRGMWPPVRLIFFTARYLPALNRFALKQMSGFYADKEQMIKRMLQALPAPDQALIAARPEVIDIFSAAAAEAHRAGLAGDAHEWQLYVHPWELDLSAVRQPIGLWYGEVDGNVPVGMGRYLAQQLPQSELHIVPDGGHFSTINNHSDAIFQFLLRG